VARGLIVTVIYGAVAAVLGLRGRAEVQQATPPVPRQAVESSKKDARWAKKKAQSARQ
jgi:hypothetical protein